MATRSFAWAEGPSAVLWKDLQSEYRTRYAVNAVVMFAVTTLAVVSFSAQVVAAGPGLLAPLLWLILLFSAMSGLSRALVREEETRTANALRLVGDPNTIYLGKLMFNALLLGLLDLIVVPLYVVVMDVQVGNPALFVAILIAGSFGLVSASTLVAAIVAKASVRGALFSVLSFPVLIPVLVAAVQGTEAALRGVSWAEGSAALKVLMAFTAAMVAAGLWLFEHVWYEA
ncbi:MAG: heme exporter protein CcmB [Armatimonadota bacterium]